MSEAFHDGEFARSFYYSKQKYARSFYVIESIAVSSGFDTDGLRKAMHAYRVGSQLSVKSAFLPVEYGND
jgi:hypothetical protein